MTKRHLLPNTVSGCTSAIIIAIATLVVGVSARAAIPAAEKLLPEDTLIVVTTPDFKRLREIYNTSPQGQLWNDPAMKAFKDHFLSQFKEKLVEPLERDLGINVSEFGDLLQGQVTFAMTQNGWETPGDSPAGFLLLVDTKENGSQLTTNIADLRRKWVDSGKNLKSEQIRGVEFLIFPVADSDIPKALKDLKAPPPPGEGWSDEDDDTNSATSTEWIIGQFESLLILGNSLKPVEQVTVHLTGGAMPALADLATFEANRVAVFRDAPVYAWINANAFLDVLNRRSAEQNAENPMAFLNPERLLQATGIGSLRSLAITFDSSPDGSLLQIVAKTPESSREGLLKVLPNEPRESGPPAFVPADAVKFQRWRIDGQKTWAALRDVMHGISPQLLNGVDFLLDTANAAAKEKDPHFDIKRNFFGNLGDDMITYEKAPTGSAAGELESPPSLFLLGSPHPEELAAAFKSILVFVNQQSRSPVEREFLGRKIISVPLASGIIPTGSRPNPRRRRTLHYAATGSYVAMSTDASMVEEFLRSSEGSQKSLREVQGLTSAAAKAGGTSTGMFAYENQAETAKLFFEALKNADTNATAKLPGLNLPGGIGALRSWMDVSLLPSFERISKYFHFDVLTVNANTDGLTIKQYSPTPPELRK